MLFAISSSPTYLSIETAMGVIVAQTTAFGSSAESAAERRNQKTSCKRRLLPMSERNFAAILLSSPVFSQETVRIEAPSSSRMVSEA